MFEIKFLLSSKIEPKKVQLATKKSFLVAKKSIPSRQKKYPYGLEDFVRVFGKLNTPYGMFESKKSQILVTHQKEDMDGTKKVQLPAKKSSAKV